MSDTTLPSRQKVITIEIKSNCDEVGKTYLTACIWKFLSNLVSNPILLETNEHDFECAMSNLPKDSIPAMENKMPFPKDLTFVLKDNNGENLHQKVASLELELAESEKEKDKFYRQSVRNGIFLQNTAIMTGFYDREGERTIEQFEKNINKLSENYLLQCKQLQDHNLFCNLIEKLTGRLGLCGPGVTKSRDAMIRFTNLIGDNYTSMERDNSEKREIIQTILGQRDEYSNKYKELAEAVKTAAIRFGLKDTALKASRPDLMHMLSEMVQNFHALNVETKVLIVETPAEKEHHRTYYQRYAQLACAIRETASHFPIDMKKPVEGTESETPDELVGYLSEIVKKNKVDSMVVEILNNAVPVSSILSSFEKYEKSYLRNKIWIPDARMSLRILLDTVMSVPSSFTETGVKPLILHVQMGDDRTSIIDTVNFIWSELKLKNKEGLLETASHSDKFKYIESIFDEKKYIVKLYQLEVKWGQKEFSERFSAFEKEGTKMEYLIVDFNSQVKDKPKLYYTDIPLSLEHGEGDLSKAYRYKIEATSKPSFDIETQPCPVNVAQQVKKDSDEENKQDDLRKHVVDNSIAKSYPNVPDISTPESMSDSDSIKIYKNYEQAKLIAKRIHDFMKKMSTFMEMTYEQRAALWDKYSKDPIEFFLSGGKVFLIKTTYLVNEDLHLILEEGREIGMRIVAEDSNVKGFVDVTVWFTR